MVLLNIFLKRFKKKNVPLLLQGGANIYAFDPVGEANFKKKYPEGKIGQGTITYVSDPKEALNGANVCFIFTEWGEVKALLPADYKELMKTPLVYDGRNIYRVNEMQEVGIEYYSIGRPSVTSTQAFSEAAATRS